MLVLYMYVCNTKPNHVVESIFNAVPFNLFFSMLADIQEFADTYVRRLAAVRLWRWNNCGWFCKSNHILYGAKC